eukprot:g2506.t1
MSLRGYDPLRSKIDEKARVKWLKHKIHGVLDLSSKSPKWQKELYDKDRYGRDCFGVGPKTAKQMSKHGVHSTFQLFGKFLSYMGPPQQSWKEGADAMWKWLESVDTPSGFRSSIIDALQEKLSAGGLEHVMEPESVGIRGRISKDVIEFINSETSRLEEMPGADAYDLERFKKAGIFTTYQLYGKFLLFALKFFPDPKGHGKSDAAILNDFYGWLRDIGIKRDGKKITTVIGLKLSMGFYIPIPGFSPSTKPKRHSLDAIDETQEDASSSDDDDDDDDGECSKCDESSELRAMAQKNELLREEVQLRKEIEGLKHRKPSQNSPHYSKLMTFYAQYEPSKANQDHVEKILAKYKGHETELFDRLRRKYVQPTKTVQAKQTSGGGGMSMKTKLYIYLALFLCFCYVWFIKLGMRWPLF